MKIKKGDKEEKLEALRNAVLNSALKSSIEEDMQLMFLNLLDSFTVYHLKILMLIYNPNEYLKKTNKKPLEENADLINLIEYAIPELNENFYKAIWNDLYTKNLFDTSSTNLFSTYLNWKDPRTTEFGDNFVLFIKGPESDVN